MLPVAVLVLLLGDVVVTGSSGTVTRLENCWTYSAIASVHPAQGQRGTVITIKGIGLFAGGAKVVRVKLSSAPVEKILTQSATEITAVVSSVFVEGDVVNDMTIDVDNKQTVKATDVFTYKIAGAIETVYPLVGQVGTVVTIKGKRLRAHGSKVGRVTLAGTDASKIISETDTEVKVIAAASAAATRDIVLHNNFGATVILADGIAELGHVTVTFPLGQWEYYKPAVITSVSPAVGQRDTKIGRASCRERV